jgi:hypothetical protein
MFRHLEADAHVALPRQIVNFIRLDFTHGTVERNTVVHIPIQQVNLLASLIFWGARQMVYPRSFDRA